MSVSDDLEAKILRYYHVEKWRIGTIAGQLHVHHGTVRRVLLRAGVPPAQQGGVSPNRRNFLTLPVCHSGVYPILMYG
jgi:hypothetical protein